MCRGKEMNMITFEEIRHNETISTYIRKADESLDRKSVV